MAKTITAAVGRMGAPNRPEDVKTVQQLLNKVPVPSGGPKPLLEPDGLCGQKTIGAIQAFQLRYFGWPGTDGRVDPNGPTLAKLNEFDGAPPSVTPSARTLAMRRVGPSGVFVDPDRPDEWFFEVSDPAQTGTSAVYHFGQSDEHKKVVTPIVFQGLRQTFQTSRSFLDLETRSASLLTDYGFPLTGEDPKPVPKRARSRFSFFYLGDSGSITQVQVAAVDHLAPPASLNLPGLDNLGGTNFSRKSGVFQFVR